MIGNYINNNIELRYFNWIRGTVLADQGDGSRDPFFAECLCFSKRCFNIASSLPIFFYAIDNYHILDVDSREYKSDKPQRLKIENWPFGVRVGTRPAP